MNQEVTNFSVFLARRLPDGQCWNIQPLLVVIIFYAYILSILFQKVLTHRATFWQNFIFFNYTIYNIFRFVFCNESMHMESILLLSEIPSSFSLTELFVPGYQYACIHPLSEHLNA